MRGVLVDHQLLECTSGNSPAIRFDDQQTAGSYIQPASFDLPMRSTFYSVAAEPDLSNGRTITNHLLAEYRGTEYSTNNSDGSEQLMPGTLYLFEVAVELCLPASLEGSANPKSSTGRNFIHSKLICENGCQFDSIPAGYCGKLYVLATPRAYPVRWSPKETLVQVRLRSSPQTFLDRWELERLHQENRLVVNDEPAFREQGLMLHLDLQSDPAILIAHRMGRTLDLGDRDRHRPHLYFWDKPLDGRAISHLEPGDMALARTHEQVRIPLGVCAEMAAIDPRHGEVRWHDAGFIDPGFGLDPEGVNDGADIVCEISNVGPSAVQLSTGREIGLLRYEWLAGTPDKPYGSAGNNYQYQKDQIRLAKQFLDWKDSHQRK